MVHGTNRNADHYFDTAKAAAFLAGALDDAVVIAPRIVCGTDKLEPNEVSWPCGGDSWRSGGMSPTHPDLSSFDFVDEILRKLAKKSVFPNMKAIVVAGHSAGGQFVNRYEMSNQRARHARRAGQLRRRQSVELRVAGRDPARCRSTMRRRRMRWPAGTARPCTRSSRSARSMRARRRTTTAGRPVSRTAPGRTPRSSRDEQLKKQLVSRPTTYLLGQVDTLPLGGFDSSPAAMAQGATRRARGEAFAKFVNEQLGAKHADHDRSRVRPQRPLHLHDRQRLSNGVSEIVAVAFSRSSAGRLTARDLGRFPAETLLDRVGRAVCHAGCLPRKELYEAWETARRVRRLFRGGRVVDLAAGHGLLAHLMLILDDTSPQRWLSTPWRRLRPRRSTSALVEELAAARRTCSRSLPVQLDRRRDSARRHRRIHSCLRCG